MPQFSTRFIIHLIPFLKPEGWPNPVIHDAYIQAADFKSLKDYVDALLAKFINQAGVIVMKESTEHLGNNINTMNLRQFIPMHMIAYIEQDTKRMVEPTIAATEEEAFKN